MYFNLHDHLNAIRAGHQRLWPRVIDEIPDPVGEELCPPPTNSPYNSSHTLPVHLY